MPESEPNAPPPTGTVVVWCPACQCKTWHFEGKCEWTDKHPVPSDAADRKSEAELVDLANWHIDCFLNAVVRTNHGPAEMAHALWLLTQEAEKHRAVVLAVTSEPDPAPPPPKPTRCTECNGTGYADQSVRTFTFGNDCPVCRGAGWLSIPSENSMDSGRNSV